MTMHAEFEQLSAYIDGELLPHERPPLEAHIATCVECAAGLAALRNTLADLATLSDAVRSEQDSWALRAAIAKERKLASRGKRAWGFSGAAAAVVAGLLAFTLTRSTTPEGGRHVAIPAIQSDTDYTQASACAALKQRGAQVDCPAVEELAAAPSLAGASSRSATAGSSSQTLKTSKGASDTFIAAGEKSAAECSATITHDAEPGTRVVATEIARYTGIPAYLYFLETPVRGRTRVELWITRATNCDVLLFQQGYR